jgi:hypothetical protein
MRAGTRIEELPPPGADGYTIQVVYDGARAGFISAALEFLATAPPNVVSASLVFDGEVINLTAEMARATAWSGAAPHVHEAGTA